MRAFGVFFCPIDHTLPYRISGGGGMPKWFRTSWPFVAAFAVGLGLLYLLTPIWHPFWALISKVLYPFFLAVIITYLLHPLVNALAKRRVPRPLAVLLIYLTFLMTFTVIVMNVTPMFMGQLRELNTHLPRLSMQAEHYMTQIQQAREVPDPVRIGMEQAFGQLEQRIQNWVKQSVSSFGATLNVVFLAMIIPFLSFYMLKDYKLFGRWILAALPTAWRRPTYRLWHDVDEALGNYVRGQVIVGVVVGVLAYVAYWFLKLPYPLLLASIVSLFNIIPYLGPFFGAAPAVLMASTISIRLMLIVIVVNLAIQVLEGNVISPQVVGKSLNMHPLAVMLALLVGGELAGILGLILAVPAFAVLRVISAHGYRFWSKLHR
jgi:predicted PurR-regulated permease PerM